MARKLKTFTTSAGFFDLAVAAPSMKAALEAWGASSNLFHQGFATQSEDPEIVAATMAKPGLVLRRPVGTQAAFSEHAQLPRNLALGAVGRAPAMHRPKAEKSPKAVDAKAEREAALAFEREQKRRERQSRREKTAREKERERRDRTIAVAEAALEKARRVHQARVGEIEKARLALDRKSGSEEALWIKTKEKLERALRRARSPRPLRLV
jgi:hypothetical protein